MSFLSQKVFRRVICNLCALALCFLIVVPIKGEPSTLTLNTVTYPVFPLGPTLVVDFHICVFSLLFLFLGKMLALQYQLLTLSPSERVLRACFSGSLTVKRFDL